VGCIPRQPTLHTLHTLSSSGLLSRGDRGSEEAIHPLQTYRRTGPAIQPLFSLYTHSACYTPERLTSLYSLSMEALTLQHPSPRVSLARASIHVCICLYIYAYIYAHTYMYVCMYTYIHTYIHTYIYTPPHTHTHKIHTHTHTHTHR